LKFAYVAQIYEMILSEKCCIISELWSILDKLILKESVNAVVFLWGKLLDYYIVQCILA
jgi:hypothetical protein